MGTRLRNKEVIHDGKKLRSYLERTCYKKLKEAGIPFTYESWQVPLVDKFKWEGKSYERVTYKGKKSFKEKSNNIRSITYKPDFIGDWWIIETKGHETEAFKIRWKLFKKYLQDNGLEYVLFKPHTNKEIDEVIKIILEYEHRKDSRDNRPDDRRQGDSSGSSERRQEEILPGSSSSSGRSRNGNRRNRRPRKGKGKKRQAK